MSSFYKTPLRSDELYHWKYKDKYKKGDHWVYIYDDGSTSEASSAKLVTTTTNDTMNKRTTYNRVVSTNPKQLFTTRSKDTIGFKSSRDRSVPGGWSKYSDEKRVADFTTTTEKVTYGRLHMERMNLERKISEIPEQSIKTVKGLISRFTHKKDDTPEGAKKAIGEYKKAVQKNPLPNNYEEKKRSVNETLKESRKAAKEQTIRDEEARQRKQSFDQQEAYRNAERNRRQSEYIHRQAELESRKRQEYEERQKNSRNNPSSKPKQTNTKENEPKKRKSKVSAAKRAARWYIYKGTY